MIKLAVIGTNWITDKFIQAALQTGRFELCAVYSRSLDKAQIFGDKYAVSYFFNDLEVFANSTEFDAVYIASPNSFHSSQSIRMLRSSKHVICEKPLASNYTAAKEMYKTAENYHVVLLEAFMTPFLPNFTVMKQNIENIGAVRKVMFSYCQYSSRYSKYLQGENPNTFNPTFANGSVMDIGYYCLGVAIELFGKPKSVYATAHILDSGVDGNGSIILGYEGFDAVIMHSKTSDSFLPSEIQGEQACLQIEMISTCNNVKRIDSGGKTTDLSIEQEENRMFYEANAFADQITSNKIDEKSKTRSLLLAKILTEVRTQTGVVFPSDT